MSRHAVMGISDPRQDRDPATWGGRARLQTLGGVYVVQFPDRVKIGKAGDVRVRVLQHRANGATRAVGLRAEDGRRVEREALRALEQRAHRVGRSESFTGISFVDAERVLATVVREIHGDWPEIVLTSWGATS